MPATMMIRLSTSEILKTAGTGSSRMVQPSYKQTGHAKCCNTLGKKDYINKKEGQESRSVRLAYSTTSGTLAVAGEPKKGLKAINKKAEWRLHKRLKQNS
jgi:hypothetical protein